MELLTDSLHRIAYATDASAYREMPMAVAYPQNAEDIRWLLEEARRRKTCLIPRAGGTSIAGQVVGSGIVVDVSRYMNRILEIHIPETNSLTEKEDKAWVRVQPGVVRDELNKALNPYGYFFSPETSTSNRCCIGGMVGNNSCGTHSLVYGSTRHHVIGVKAILTDGEEVEFGIVGSKNSKAESQKSKGESQKGRLEEITAQLDHWKEDTTVRKLLEDNFPDRSLRRRSCGYALDECLAGEELNIPALICGSEGTLCFVTEITLSLDPLPAKHKMVVCELLDNLNDAWQANLKALQRKPVAVELIDGKILELAKDNIEARRNMEVLRLDLTHLPKAILVSEFELQEGESFPKEIQDDWDKENTVLLYDEDVQKVWNLRKAGLGVLTSVEGDAKPIGVIEDTAIAPERMAAYMEDFQQMMSRLGLDCVYYGHISTGELHLRPILDIKKAEDRRKFREVAEETARLVKKHRGSLSGEHGDGRLRGEFIPLMYGEEVYALFKELKHTWDPEELMNMGKIVDTPPMDSFLRYDVGQEYAFRSKTVALSDRDTVRSRTAALIKDKRDLMQRIERCNGAGDCRKSNVIGGTMCPAFKVSGEETKTTRARANVLREKLTHDPEALHSPEVKEVLDSCLACKGCKSECPSNVDMTRLRSEVLQLKYDEEGVPFRSWMVARMAVVERLGSLVPMVYNWFATNRLTSSVIKRVVKFSAERQIPTLSRHSMRWLVNKQSLSNSPLAGREQTPPDKGSQERNLPKVYLFADEFTNYQEAELGLKFAELLRKLGYRVEVPKHVESGRAAISKGCLCLAAKYAKKNVQLLKDILTDETPLVGIEPSCILSFRDEYPRLVDKKDEETARQLAKNCLLYDEWLMREVEKGRISKDCFSQGSETAALSDCCAIRKEQSEVRDEQIKIYLHGHCHQKALVGVEKTADCLRLIPNAEVKVIPSGCCGMAGSFGYEQEHYKTSMEIGEMVLLPAVRRAMKDKEEKGQKVIVCAPGTSCRQQIMDGTGVKAYHPIEVLWQFVN